MLEKIAHLAQRAAGSLRVRSALNPMLWLCAIAVPMCFVTAYYFRQFPIVMIGLRGPARAACCCCDRPV